jgi:hypothetical protein
MREQNEVQEEIEGTEGTQQNEVNEVTVDADTDVSPEETGIEQPESETVSEESEESSEEATLDAQIANLKKQDAAVLLVKKAKHIVQDAEAQMEACKLLLSDDLKGYEAAKLSMKNGGMDDCETLLDTLEYSGEAREEHEENVVFEAKEEVTPVIIQEVSSGKFTGFLLALLLGVATLSGLVFLATQKLGIALDLSTIPSTETRNSILSWFGSLVGTPDPMIGGALLGVVVLLVMWIVYTIRVAMKAGSNLQFAKEQLKQAEEYAALKGTCKDEMDKVDAHIKDAIEVMKTYEIIFNEQKGKLRRIQYLEKEGKEAVSYHQKSRKEMEDTYDLIGAIKDFLNTSMSEEGKLSGKSTLFLYRAKNRLEKMIDQLY